jgi:hypothetical protein
VLYRRGLRIIIGDLDRSKGRAEIDVNIAADSTDLTTEFG